MSARVILCAVLFWWFALNTSSHVTTGRVVGPFESREMCESVRAQFGIGATACWSDGQPLMRWFDGQPPIPRFDGQPPMRR